MRERSTEKPGELAVSEPVAERGAGEELPSAAREGRADEGERKIEALQPTREIRVNLPLDFATERTRRTLRRTRRAREASGRGAFERTRT